MLISVRRHGRLVASLLFVFPSGCTLPDRLPTILDAGPSSSEDASARDVTLGDVPRDVTLGDVLRDVGDVSVGDSLSAPDAPRDDVVRDAPNTTIDAARDAPITCVPGGTCLPPSNPCHQGELDCADGGAATCRDTARSQANGTTCDKGACLDGVCQACASGTKCDIASQPCRVGTVVCATGAPVCTETDNKPNGTTCASGSVCQEGMCKPCVTGEACTPANACHLGKLDCSTVTPTCSDTAMSVPAGGSCGQDKVCSPSGTCVACVAGSTCSVAGNACRTGTTACNTGAPVCIESGNAPNGSSCGAAKVCSGGDCVSCSVGLSCVPTNPCHSGTTVCSPAVDCVDTGTALTDGTACGTDQVCSGGTCSPCAAGKSCQTTNTCKAGSTSCATGVSKCNEAGDQPDGTSCGTNQVCAKGVCGMCTTGASCTPTNPCHTGALGCATGMPTCADNNASVADGTSCGTNLVCRMGACVSCTAGTACQPTDACKSGTTSCTSGSSVCVANANKAPGTSCGTDMVCNSAGACVTCNNGDMCTPSNKCHVGSLSCATGAPVCTDTGGAVSNGTNCGTNLVCSNGSCVSCTDGLSCAAANVCKNGAISCATGSAVCAETTNKTQGTPCGAGQSCVNGRTTAATTCNASGQCATPTVTTCASGACNSAGTDCLVCSAGQTACGGACCAAGQGCCSNTCTALNTTSNCGVCGNACATGKACGGTQCAWPNGHVCASPADCVSGSCGGRCCPAGTSCSCTQPTSVNMLANPSFDTGIAGWTAAGGSVAGGSVTWVSGPSGDAEGCPFSGGIRVTCPSSTMASCYVNSECFTLPKFADYNFGYRENSARFGPNVCGIELFEGVGCTGTNYQADLNAWLGTGWSSFLFSTINTDVHVSGRIYCYATPTDADATFDMIYLSPTPGGY